MKAFLWIGLILVVFVAFGGTISSMVESAKAEISGVFNHNRIEGPELAQTGQPALSQPDGIVYKYYGHNSIGLLDGRRLKVSIQSCNKGYTREWVENAFSIGTRVHVRFNNSGEPQILRAEDHLDLAIAASKASVNIC